MDLSERGGEDRSFGEDDADPEFNNRAPPEDQYIDNIRLNQMHADPSPASKVKQAT